MPDSVRSKHSHYHKNVTNLDFIDVYRVLQLFNVTDPCIQHTVKKLLVAGGRGAGKDITRDIQESIDSLKRWQEMRTEEAIRTEELNVYRVTYIGIGISSQDRAAPRINHITRGILTDVKLEGQMDIRASSAQLAIEIACGVAADLGYQMTAEDFKAELIHEGDDGGKAS